MMEIIKWWKQLSFLLHERSKKAPKAQKKKKFFNFLLTGARCSARQSERSEDSPNSERRTKKFGRFQTAKFFGPERGSIESARAAARARPSEARTR